MKDLRSPFARAGATLDALGIAAPAASPPVPPGANAARISPPELLADSVVCAAAEAARMTPPDVRPALLAAFRRGQQLGLTVEQLESALSRKAD